MNKIIDRIKVARIQKLIDRQIENRVKQLATFVQLKEALEKRVHAGHGTLLSSDLDYIKAQLKGLTNK